MFDGATYGLEYDCGMLDRKKVLRPELGVYCTDEVSSHSNAGVGADPLIEINLFGGEVQMTPCNSEEELYKNLMMVLDECLHTDDFQMRSTIHVHIRMPRLLERPDLIRQIVHWTNKWWPVFAPEVYKWEDRDESDYSDWMERCMRMVKGQTYSKESLARMDASDTTDPGEIALLLHDHPKDWKNEWQDLDNHFKQKRPAVNFGHLFLNETIEFRMFMSTANRQILKNIIGFPRKFLTMALTNDPDPLRILKGLELQDVWGLSEWSNVPAVTTAYFNCRLLIKSAISIFLNKGELTVKDLNYPDFWIDKGYQ